APLLRAAVLLPANGVGHLVQARTLVLPVRGGGVGLLPDVRGRVTLAVPAGPWRIRTLDQDRSPSRPRSDTRTSSSPTVQQFADRASSRQPTISHHGTGVRPVGNPRVARLPRRPAAMRVLTKKRTRRKWLPRGSPAPL